MSTTTHYHDARDEPSSASLLNKQNNALNHFNFFLGTYCQQIGIDIVKAVDIPYEGIPKKSKPEDVFEF